MTERLIAAVPFYAGLDLDAIGGRGERWQEGEAVSAFAWKAPAEAAKLEIPAAAPPPSDGALRLGTFRSLWAAKEVDLSPLLQFARAEQVVELSPDDAARLGISHGDTVEVSADDVRVSGPVQLRSAVPPGSVFLREGHAVRARQRAHQRRPDAAGAGAQGCRRVSALATVGYHEEWWIQIIKGVVIFAVVFNLVPLVLVYERKLLGRFQHRYGPNRVGPFGLLQPIADIIKLATKEEFRPRNAVAFLFTLAPIISVLTACATIAIIPFGNTVEIFGETVGLYGIDANIGILYAFAFGAIAFYGLMLGGWASGSKFSFLGAMRSAAQLISYEVAMGLSLVGVLMMAGTLSLTGIVAYQADNLWFLIPQAVGFIIFTVSAFAETNRAPFDLPEADAEIVAGYNTEYGGGRFASYYLAEYLNVVVISGIAVTIFLGGWDVPIWDQPNWIEPLVVLFKMFLFVTFFIWIRATLPRLRYDQLMSFGWKVLLPLATLNALVTAILVVSF